MTRTEMLAEITAAGEANAAKIRQDYANEVANRPAPKADNTRALKVFFIASAVCSFLMLSAAVAVILFR